MNLELDELEAAAFMVLAEEDHDKHDSGNVENEEPGRKINEEADNGQDEDENMEDEESDGDRDEEEDSGQNEGNKHKEGGKEKDEKRKDDEEPTQGRQEEDRSSTKEESSGQLDLSLARCSKFQSATAFLNFSGDTEEGNIGNSSGGSSEPEFVSDILSFDDVNHASNRKVLIEELGPATSKDGSNSVCCIPECSMHNEGGNSHSHDDL